MGSNQVWDLTSHVGQAHADPTIERVEKNQKSEKPSGLRHVCFQIQFWGRAAGEERDQHTRCTLDFRKVNCLLLIYSYEEERQELS